MKVNFDKEGFIRELLINKKNVIFPWGIETADSKGFFSLNEEGVRQKIISKNFHLKNKRLVGKIKARLPFSLWELKIDESFNKKIIRKHELTCKENCQFNDFVSRFVFRKEFVKEVEIAGKKLIHRDTRFKYEYPVKSVKVSLKGGGKIIINLKKYKTIKFLEPTIYVRDLKDRWIVHIRLFPKNPEIKQIKITRKSFNKALPQRFSDLILRSKRIKEFLWYRGRTKRFSPINAMGLVLAKKGDVLMLETEVRYVP